MSSCLSSFCCCLLWPRLSTANQAFLVTAGEERQCKLITLFFFLFFPFTLFFFSPSSLSSALRNNLLSTYLAPLYPSTGKLPFNVSFRTTTLPLRLQRLVSVQLFQFWVATYRARANLSNYSERKNGNGQLARLLPPPPPVRSLARLFPPSCCYCCCGLLSLFGKLVWELNLAKI